jgi:trans-2,3-dihydro-3-hydroxyanthranilate isomerase
MKYKYYITDVFTNKSFNGAQIAVFPNADGLDQIQMQILSRELNLSETTFVFSEKDGSGKYRVRTFNPQSEIDFAGHPMIAIGHVLASIDELKLEKKHTPLLIEQNSGVIEASVSQEDGKPSLVQFSLETNPVIDHFVPVNKDIAAVVSLNESDIDISQFQSRLVFTDQSYLVVPIKSYSAVRNAKFNFNVWSQSIAGTCMAKEILLFSKQSDIEYSNFNARLLGPDIGIHEDPPIGSSMPAFTSYLCDHEHISEGTHTFVIDRGIATIRKSVLNIEMDKKSGESLKIRVGGPAVIVGEGTISAPEK